MMLTTLLIKPCESPIADRLLGGGRAEQFSDAFHPRSHHRQAAAMASRTALGIPSQADKTSRLLAARIAGISARQPAKWTRSAMPASTARTAGAVQRPLARRTAGRNRAGGRASRRRWPEATAVPFAHRAADERDRAFGR